MEVKKSLTIALSLVAVAVAADPAPVADLSRSAGNSYTAQPSERRGSFEERLTALERVVEARGAAQLNLQQQLETLLDEVSQLRGTTEVQANQLDKMLQEQRNIYQEIDRRLGGQASTSPAAPNDAGGVTPANNAPAGNPAAVVAADQLETSEEPVAEAPAAKLSEAEMWQVAVDHAAKGKESYPAAIKTFEEFNKTYPNSSYKPRVHYYLGQLYYQKDSLKTAKTHFDTIVKKFPNSDKVPDSLLKLGQITERQNDAVAAKKYYNQLVKSFPKSKAATKARARLEAL
jgi:tol-pal system protein YbgF